MAKKPRKKLNAKLKSRFFNVLIWVSIILIALIVTGQFPLFNYFQVVFSSMSGAAVPGSDLAAGSPEKFAFLSGQSEKRSVANYCGLATSYVKTLPDSARIQGSCCSPMDLHQYQEQVEGLKAYANIPQVSHDPYGVSVALVKQWLQFADEINLTADEQMIYDQAMQMTSDKGPCCCKC